MKVELLEGIEVTAALETTMIAVRDIVEGFNLSEQEKRGLLNNIATWPVVVEKHNNSTLDRLGRSVKGLVDLVNEVEAQKVHFQSITDGIDTKTPPGDSSFTLCESSPNGAPPKRLAKAASRDWARPAGLGSFVS